MKKYLLITLALILTITLFMVFPHYKKGDINKDGNITITDLVIVNRATIKGKEKQFNYKLGDMDNDKEITKKDVQIINNIILNK